MCCPKEMSVRLQNKWKVDWAERRIFDDDEASVARLVGGYRVHCFSSWFDLFFADVDAGHG